MHLCYHLLQEPLFDSSNLMGLLPPLNGKGFLPVLSCGMVSFSWRILEHPEYVPCPPMRQRMRGRNWILPLVSLQLLPRGCTHNRLVICNQRIEYVDKCATECEVARAKPCCQGQKWISQEHRYRRKEKGRKEPAFVECLLLKHFHVQEGKTDMHICYVLGSVLCSLKYIVSSGSPNNKEEPPYFSPVFLPFQQMCIFSTFYYFRPKAKKRHRTKEVHEMSRKISM